MGGVAATTPELLVLDELELELDAPAVPELLLLEPDELLVLDEALELAEVLGPEEEEVLALEELVLAGEPDDAVLVPPAPPLPTSPP
jgi:hypothetical protein